MKGCVLKYYTTTVSPDIINPTNKFIFEGENYADIIPVIDDMDADVITLKLHVPTFRSWILCVSIVLRLRLDRVYMIFIRLVFHQWKKLSKHLILC